MEGADCTWHVSKTLIFTLTLSGPTSTVHVQTGRGADQREAPDRGLFAQPEAASGCFRGTGHQQLSQLLALDQCVAAGLLRGRGRSRRAHPGQRNLFTMALT